MLLEIVDHVTCYSLIRDSLRHLEGWRLEATNAVGISKEIGTNCAMAGHTRRPLLRARHPENEALPTRQADALRPLRKTPHPAS